MKTSNKIAAFTLSEMVVVIILTSIIVGIGFSVLSMVQNHMKMIQANFTKSAELDRLQQSLWLDFNRYSTINYKPLEDELVFTNDFDSINYKFSSETLVKGVDTFQVSIEKKAFFFDGNPIQEGVLDALKLNLDKSFQNQVLFVFKKNDAVQFIN